MGGLLMFKLNFTNSKGQSIEIYGPPFRLIKFDGLGEVGAKNQFQGAPYQDGSTYIDSVLENRPLSIELMIQGNDTTELEINRSLLLSIFNPKLGPGVLRYIGKSGEKEISVVSISVPFLPDGRTNRTKTKQRALINLEAPDPYWMDISDTTEPLEAWIGLFKFPLRFPMKFGRKGESRTLVNKGDVATPVLIEFTGPAANPRITNKTTGEFIKVNRTLNAGDTLVINTAFGQKRVEIINNDGTRTNVFNWIDPSSTFFNLDEGENEIEYTADTGKESAVVKLTYRNRYVGV